MEDAAAYRQQYNSNRTRIEELKSELAEWQQKQKEYADAKQEAEAENDVKNGRVAPIDETFDDLRQLLQEG